MMENRLGIHKNRIVVLPVLTIFILAVLLTFGGSWLTSSSNSNISSLDQGWTVSRGNDVQTDVTLSKYKLGKTTKGEQLIISNWAYMGEDTSFMFRSKLEAVTVFVDGKLVYSYGKDYIEQGRLIPKKYNLITLNKKPGLHNLIIVFSMGENNYFQRFSPVFFGYRSDLMRAFYSYKRISFFLGGFLVVYSCVLFSLWIYMIMSRRKALQLFISANFSMLLGCFIYSQNDILWFVGSHDMFFSLMEYTSFYLMPLAFSLILYTIRPNIAKNRQRIAILVNIVFPILYVIMHFSGIVHLSKFEFETGVIAVVEIVIILPTVIKHAFSQYKVNYEEDYNAGEDAEIYLLIGFIILILSALVEIVRFFIWGVHEDISRPELFSSVDFLEFGMIFFMLCYFVYYFLNSVNHMSADRVKAQLEDLAYIDNLTKLRNRAACRPVFATLTGEYAIVSLDLDRLKFVNDNYGHLEGDRMLATFGKFLKKAFSEADLVARTGGDEFTVLFKNPSNKLLNSCIERLEEEMQAFNEAGDVIKLSASIGYAFSYEVNSRRYRDVFSLADQRMYEMKEAHHE